MNTMRLERRSPVAPAPLEVALQDHVHGLEHQAPVLALHVQDALGAQDVRALRLPAGR